jgi:hypothetical protein
LTYPTNTKELGDITRRDQYPFSERIRTQKAILAKLKPEPVREPFADHALVLIGPTSLPSCDRFGAGRKATNGEQCCGLATTQFDR